MTSWYVFLSSYTRIVKAKLTDRVISCRIRSIFSPKMLVCSCRMSMCDCEDEAVRAHPSPVPPACLLSGSRAADPLCCWCGGWTNCEPYASAWGVGRPKPSRCCCHLPQASSYRRGRARPPPAHLSPGKQVNKSQARRLAGGWMRLVCYHHLFCRLKKRERSSGSRPLQEV